MGVVLVVGPEPFLAREAVRSVLARRPEFDVTRYDGKSATVAEVLDDVRTPALLGGGRAVVVEHAEELLKGETLEALAAYAEKPGDASLLVLQATSLDRRYKAAQRLAKAAEQTIDCKPPFKPWEFERWIAERGRQAHGLQVGRDAAAALRRRIGEELGLLDGALARLAEQIAPRKRLGPGDIEESTEEHRSPVLYEPANALEAKDLSGALRALDAAFDEGVRMRQAVVTEGRGIALILLSNLHRTYTRLLRFWLAREAGRDEPQAARAAGASPRQAPYFVESARQWSLPALLEGHRHFVEADLALKSESGGTDRAVLETMLLRLLGQARTNASRRE